MSAKKKTTAKKAPAKKKAAAKKAPAKKKAAAKKAPAKKAATKKKATPKAMALSPEERYQRVEFEAYLMAEKNGFAADPSSYWIEAEKIVDSQFA